MPQHAPASRTPRTPRASRLPRLTGAVGVTSLALTLLAATPTAAVAPPLSDPHVLVHFDLSKGQTPENIALEPDGAADLTFVGSRQVARVGVDGRIEVLATLPDPGVANTPIVGVPAVTGIVRDHDGTLYFSYSTGTAELTGIWRLAPGGTPRRIAALPVDGLANGLALDEHARMLYSADSALGVVHRVPLDGGPATVWASGERLRRIGFIGANGLKLHHDAVWVTNSDRATLLRIPICDGGTAGPVEVRAEGLTGVDDFAFTGHGDAVLAALNTADAVAYVTPDGAHSIVLTREDGLSNPTAVAVRGPRVHVTSAAFTSVPPDPNLLVTRLDRPKHHTQTR
ncbi:hypothetical protein AB0K43_28610 [Kitasatospora sp. NPDC049258]|uniref:SMP-30/gluconolactonase/LRE family protein n=1 Tax=Kitasatospora sp. NPDC049258 TaxID=3155394 RepID=UPI003423B6F1